MIKKILAVVLVVASILMLVGCSGDEFDPTVIDDNPPIDVNLASTGTHVDIQQDVIADANNSSTANVNAGITWQGTSTSTLGAAGIQVSLKTDQNCIVTVEQSPNAVPNWDVVDTFEYIYSLGGASWTVQAVNSYVRVTVTNVGASNTTFFRLQTALCPIVEAMPRSLTEGGRLKTSSTLVDDYGFEVEFTPMDEMRVVEPVKLVGATFIGTTVDPNFWQSNVTGSGAVTQASGNLVLTTGVTADSTASVSSIRRARYVAGSSLRYRAIVKQQAGTADNVRRWGATDWIPTFAVTDGTYFKLTGTVLSVSYMAGSVEMDINNGSFNGVCGATYTLDTNYHTYEIYWTNTKLYYVIDGELLHSVSMTNSNWTDTPTLYLWADNRNSNGSITAVTTTIKVMSIYRLGKMETSPTYRHISTATTTICKYGAGTLHSILLNNPTNNTITVYDNTAAAGAVIAIINPGSSATPLVLNYDLDFSTGLTIVTAGTPDITVTYE